MHVSFFLPVDFKIKRLRPNSCVASPKTFNTNNLSLELDSVSAFWRQANRFCVVSRVGSWYGRDITSVAGGVENDSTS